jgi:hypothetical protein
MSAKANELVVTRLTGGLGNQLFQYAAALGVAHASGAKVALDVSAFLTCGPDRKYSLAPYRLGLPLLTQSSFDPLHRIATIPLQEKLVGYGAQSSLQIPVFREDNYEFDPSIKSLRGSCYLHGFWQSWKYFSEVSQILRQQLRIAPTNNPHNDRIAGQISDSESVALHVRRSDYLQPHNRNAFGICDPSYYAFAASRMRERVSNPKFFVFSDAPEWCSERFTDKDFTVASTVGGDAVDDLALMARCRHHIAANSSFSWWGAWLAQHNDAVVIAPIPWYTESPHAYDLIPDRWIRLNRQTGADWSIERAAMSEDKVSVIILSAGGRASLIKALSSVTSQTYRNVEMIVAFENDARGTKDLSDVATTIDAHIQFVHGPRPGKAAARNAAIACATGDWIAFLDDCDAWLPRKLQVQIETAHLVGADAISCRTIPIEGPSGIPPLFPPPGPPECSLSEMEADGYSVSGVSHMLVRRQFLNSLGGFDESLPAGEDQEFWIRLSRRTQRVMLWERLVMSPIPFLAKQSSRA